VKSEKKNDSHLLVKMKQHLRLACWVVVVGAVFQFVTTTEVLNYQIVAYDCHDSAETQVALPPVHWNSSWVGNTWILPPKYVSYPPERIRKYFSQQSVLYISDSTARRTMTMMFYAMINASNPNDVTLEELDSDEVINAGKFKPLLCDKKMLYIMLSNVIQQKTTTQATKSIICI
jgi:hypothetical protein